jgi:hypothetical protein
MMRLGVAVSIFCSCTFTYSHGLSEEMSVFWFEGQIAACEKILPDYSSQFFSFHRETGIWLKQMREKYKAINRQGKDYAALVNEVTNNFLLKQSQNQLAGTCKKWMDEKEKR